MTLTEFLLARIDEDEVLARDARASEESHQPPTSVQGSAPALKHILRHDPARVLADCEAKRRMVTICNENPESVGGDFFLRMLASPYSKHPDYQQEWRVD